MRQLRTMVARPGREHGGEGVNGDGHASCGGDSTKEAKVSNGSPPSLMADEEDVAPPEVRRVCPHVTHSGVSVCASAPCVPRRRRGTMAVFEGLASVAWRRRAAGVRNTSRKSLVGSPFGTEVRGVCAACSGARSAAGVSRDPVCGAELRLSRLYGVNTPAPLVQVRTRTEVESPVRAVDLPPPSPTTTTSPGVFHSMVNVEPWKPAGPATRLMVRSCGTHLVMASCCAGRLQRGRVGAI